MAGKVNKVSINVETLDKIADSIRTKLNKSKEDFPIKPRDMGDRILDITASLEDVPNSETMDNYLVRRELKSIYKYTGVDTDKYKKNRLYLIIEE